PSALEHEEMRAPESHGDGQDFSRKTQDAALRRVYGVLVTHRHTDAGDDEERPEHVEHPVVVLQHVAACEDERGAHDERAEDSPEQHTVLVGCRYTEVREDEDEYEQVVDGERLLDQVTGQELECLVPADQQVDAEVEQQ